VYTTKGEVLTDDNLVFFIRNLQSPQQQQPQNQQSARQSQPPEQQLYGGSREDAGDISYHNDKLSDMFSFIDNEDNMAFNKDYDFIDSVDAPPQQQRQQGSAQHPQQMQRRQTGNPTFPEPIDTRRNTNKTDGSELERLIAQRDAEIGL
jgi:hypothetical protein